MLRQTMYWLATLAGLYLLLVLLLFLLQERMIFPGAGQGDRPLEAPDALQTVRLVRPGGAPFRAVVCRGDEVHGVLAFFAGNGEDLRSGARWAMTLAAHGLCVVVPEYPGYGLSAGRPSLAALYEVANATAAHAEQLARAAGVPFLLGGSSLGTFCATHAAAAHPPARLLLIAAPTSMAAAAAVRFWWLPVGLLLRHRFDNVANAAAVQCPVLLVHGDADSIVPLRLGQELAAVLGARARWLVVPGGGHNDLLLAGDSSVGGELRSFLRGE